MKTGAGIAAAVLANLVGRASSVYVIDNMGPMRVSTPVSLFVGHLALAATGRDAGPTASGRAYDDRHDLRRRAAVTPLEQCKSRPLRRGQFVTKRRRVSTGQQ
jgi:hypothetical protein